MANDLPKTVLLTASIGAIVKMVARLPWLGPQFATRMVLLSRSHTPLSLV